MPPSVQIPQTTPLVSPPDATPFLGTISDWIGTWWPSVVASIQHSAGVIIGLSLPLSLFFLIGIIYCVEQLKRIRAKEHQIYDEPKVETAPEDGVGSDPGLARRWDAVSRHIESPNQNDWKQAIIEADVMLDDILTRMGYRGESVGEKLKRVQPGDFQSVQDAWDAHKVRNRIAHDGSGFEIGHLEAKRVISQYKKVFEEFYYV